MQCIQAWPGNCSSPPPTELANAETGRTGETQLGSRPETVGGRGEGNVDREVTTAESRILLQLFMQGPQFSPVSSDYP